MATAIQFLRSSVPSLRPTPQSLSEGMPMVNFNASDPGLYLRLNDQSLVKIGPTHVNTLPPNYNPTGFEGLCAGEMWLDMSTTASKPRPVLKLWDGTQWVEAGGSISSEELPQKRNTVYAGPETGADEIPTFRELVYDDLPDDIPTDKLAGGKQPGILLIGGNAGWGENHLGTGDGSLTATLGENSLTLEVTAGNIAGVGSNGQIDTGDGHVQLNYDGKFTADNRFKFLRAGDGLVHSYTSTEFGQNAAVHTHTFVGATSFEGNVTLTNVYDLTVGGDLFVGHNAQIGSNPNELLEVFNKTEFNSDVFIKDFNNLDVGGNAVIHSNTTLGDSDVNTLTVAATSTFNASMTVGRGCVTSDVFTANADSVFECDVLIKGELSTSPGGTVDFPGDVVLGTDCNNFIKVQGTQLNNCDIFVGTNVPDPNAQMLTIEAATGNLTTKGEVFITEKLTVSNPLNAAPPKFVVDGPTGDVDSEGTVTAAFFSGDGSQLFNLAVPNAMLFHGDINATTGGDPVPTGAQPGDFWLNNTTGTVDASWPDIGGQPIQQDQFIYYSQDTPTTFKWNLGSVQNNQGFVTINTAQDINGSKTFKAPTFFDDDIEVRDQKTTLLTGTLTVKEHTQLDDTLTVADNKATLLGGTLTVKDDTEIRGDLTVQDGQDTVLGKDLTVKQDSFFGSSCTNLFQVNALAKFLCGLEIGDPGSPCPLGNEFDVYLKTNIFCDTKITQDLTVEGSTELGTGCTDLFTVFAQTLIKCATTITNTFEVLGSFATTLGGTLTVQNATQLNSTLTVTGDTTLGAKLSVTGDTTLGATLTVAGATTLNSTLVVNGVSRFNAQVTVDSTLNVTGNTFIGGSFTVADTKPSVLGGTLTVKGDSTLQGTLTVSDTKATVLGGTLLVKEATILGNSKDCAQTFLTVNGKSVFECLATFNEGILIPGDHDLEVGGDIIGHGDLTIDGNTTLGTTCTDTLTVTATTTINCPTTVNNTFTVNGNFATTLGGNLTVADGKVTTLGGTLTVKGATALQDTLTVTGATQLNNTLVVADGQATTLGGTLLVKQATTLNNTLTVAQATQLNGSLTVADNQTTVLGGTLTVKQATTLQSTLTVTSATQLNDTLTVADAKATVLGGTLLVKQATTLGAAKDCGQTFLTVNGLSVFECLATFNGGISIPGTNDLTVGGNLTVNGNTTLGDSCSDTLTITATTAINCATTIASTFTVSGANATTLGGTLAVTGATTLSSTLNVTGNTSLSGTLTVADGQATTCGGTLTVKQATSLQNTLTVANGQATVLGGTLQVKGTSTLQDNVTVSDGKSTLLGGTLTVKLATTLQDTLTVADSKASVLGGTLQVKGDSTLNGTLTVSDSKASTLGGTLLVKQLTTLGSAINCSAQILQVNGKSTFECEATFNNGLNMPSGDLTLGGSLTVKGNTTIGDNCTDLLTVTATSTFNCPVTIDNSLTIGATQDCTSTKLTVNSKAAFECEAEFKNGLNLSSGNLTVDNNFTVKGNTVIGDNCTDTLVVTATTTINCPTTVANTFTVSGNNATTLGGTLAVTGATTLSSTLAVTGNVSVATNKFTVDAATGNTVVAGTLTVQSNAVTALAISGKGTSASTIDTDTAATLVTKDYLLAKVEAGTAIQSITGGDGISVTAPDVSKNVVVSSDHNTSKGLDIETGKLVTKIGAGLEYDASGNIAVTTNSLSYVGTVDLTTATIPGGAAVVQGASFANTGAGTMNAAWQTATGEGPVSVQPGDLAIYDGTAWTYVPTGGVASVTDLGLDNRNINTLDITSSTGLDQTIPKATTALSGLMSGTDKGILDALKTSFDSLGDGKIWIGDATGAQAAQTMSGDITITRAGVTKIKDSVALAASPTTTTQAAGTSNTTIATTEFVTNAISAGAVPSLNSAEFFLGNAANVTQQVTMSGDATLSNTGVLDIIDNVNLGGSPTSTTQAAGTNNTTLATTEFVTTAVAAAGVPDLTSAHFFLGDAANATQQVTMSGDATLSNTGQLDIITNVNLDGSPTTTTQPTGTSNTTIATTAFVSAAVTAAGGSPWVDDGSSSVKTVNAGRDILPNVDGDASIGSASKRWANVYTQDMHFSNEGTEGNSIDGTTGNWTLQEGHDHLYFINNKTGVKFRVVMEQV